MDISIYDNYTGVDRDFNFFPIDGQYKFCDSLLVIICMGGEAVFNVSSREFTVRRNTFFVIGPDVPFFIKSKSDRFKIDVIRVGKQYFNIANDTTLRMLFERMIHESPLNYLNERKTRMFHIIHSYLKVLHKESDPTYRDMIVLEYIKILFYEACRILSGQKEELSVPRKEKVLSGQFFKEVEMNFRKTRKVEFYAEKLGITSKHLAFTIKKVTRRHPSDWIDDYSLLEAKKMLKHMDYTIQEISFDLNFATPSHFSKFFKSKTGMTPKEFRNSEITEQIS